MRQRLKEVEFQFEMISPVAVVAQLAWAPKMTKEAFVTVS